MQSDLPLLVKLQEFDVAIDAADQKAQSVAPLIAKKTQELEGLKTSLKAAKEKAATYTMKKKNLEAQGEEKEKDLKKHQAALNSLKSNDAYKAMLSEIEAAKNAVVQIEDEILVVMESIESADKEYKATEQKLKSDESVIKAAIQDLEKQKAELEAQAAQKKADRATFAATISPASLSQYEGIRSRRGGIAIVPMVANSCGECRMNLTQNQLIEIKKAKNVVSCNNCMRIIYVPPQDAPAVAPSPAPTV
jgi:uncharacterized protein